MITPLFVTENKLFPAIDVAIIFIKIMEIAVDKRYKFINSETGYVIFYHTLNFNLPALQAKTELENIKKQVAVKNSILVSTIYWEEIKS